MIRAIPNSHKSVRVALLGNYVAEVMIPIMF